MTLPSGHRRLPTVPVPPLRTIYFYLTEGCNLACRHCWLAPVFSRHGVRGAVLPVATFRRVLREARPLGLAGVKLTGGEPLLHPRLDALLDLIEADGLRLNLETNGLLCSPQLARRIARLPGVFVSVSLDGAGPATHDWMRGVRGAFVKACSAVRRLSDAGAPPQIVMTLSRRNVHEIEDLIALAERLGAASVKFNLMQPTARGRDLAARGEGVPVTDLAALGRRVEDSLSRQTPIRLHFDYPPAFRSLRRIATSDDFCGITGILGVLSTGHYSLCGIGTHVKKLVLGVAGVDDIKPVWARNPVLRDIRSGLPSRLRGICRSCLMKGLCQGQCIAQNYYRTGSFWGPYWFCEEAARRGIFPASRRAGEARGAAEQKRRERRE